MNDRLNKFYEKQLNLQEKLYEIDELVLNQSYINLNIMALFDEVSEVLRETAWKNPKYTPFGWKTKSEINQENLKEELVDVLHFFINMCIASGMGPDELFERYINKNKENHERKDSGY